MISVVVTPNLPTNILKPPKALSQAPNSIQTTHPLTYPGNEIMKLEGLMGCVLLEELVVDKNRIKSLDELSLINQLNLMELHIEENRWVKGLEG